MGRRVAVAVLGGTFDRLHRGHRALLAAGFEAAEEVRIGLTTARFLASHPKPFGERIAPYARRRDALRRYLERTYPGRRYEIVPLNDRFGGALAPGLDLLVVSAETRRAVGPLNRARRRLGRAPLDAITVPEEYGDDLLPIRSRRIREGLIDPDGRRRVPLLFTVDVPPGVSARRLAVPLRDVMPFVPLATRRAPWPRGPRADYALRWRHAPGGNGGLERIELRSADGTTRAIGLRAFAPTRANLARALRRALAPWLRRRPGGGASPAKS